MNRYLQAVLCFLFLSCTTFPAQQEARVESFSPLGTVKKVRQARALFSEPMVPFGDPQAGVSPFEIQCTAKGTARWADPRNWIFDFDEDLEAGVHCTFRLRQGLKTIAGRDVTGNTTFSFSTGGPAILSSRPYQGSSYIDEEQIFVLQLDGEATEASVLSGVYFAVAGIRERVGTKIISGAQRDGILKAEYGYTRNLPPHLILLQAARRFPPGANVSLVWGKGVASLSGVTTDQDQLLPFVVRRPFTAAFHCMRENEDADCVPISAMRVSFSAPVEAEMVRAASLTGPGGKKWLPKISTTDDGWEERLIQGFVFEGPFPERSSFTLDLPRGIRDDAGRALSNEMSFPISVRTDEYPALAKFAADFGILEFTKNSLLPVTLRNVEPELTGRLMQVRGGEGMVDPPTKEEEDRRLLARLEGRIYRVPSDEVSQMLHWIDKIDRRRWDDREKSVFGPVTEPQAKAFSIPKPNGGKAFEVVGIPLESPGFYVVELRSELLGAALLGVTKPMYVPTTVLVTNLAVHFKWGIDSSLVWVTTLDTAKPVSQAAVEIRDCEGRLLWQGKTDRSGIARVEGLPAPGSQPQCPDDMHGSGLSVSARSGRDMAFVHSSWNEGIEPWRFRLPVDYQRKTLVTQTVLDRSLFRAGETVHMKHILRRRLTTGFSLCAESERPRHVIVQHLGSNQRYEVGEVKWDGHGSAESEWTIPRDVKLGEYQILLLRNEAQGPFEYSGEFRVEEFRVPLMKGVIRPPEDPQILPASVPLDITVSYLAGGGAGNLPVRLRYDVRPGYGHSFDEFEDFIFSNGRVREGQVRGTPEETLPEQSELHTMDLTLDRTGSTRAVITDLPKPERPMVIATEIEFRDPNGEAQTVATRIPLWTAGWHVGLRPESWALSRESVKFRVAVVDLQGKPVASAPVKVDLLQRKHYSHRKRLVGGFYAYEHSTEITRLSTVCEGKTDPRGLLICEKPLTVSGNVILQAEVIDPAGNLASAHSDVWVAGGDEWWFDVREGDRMDLLPESRRYEPGQKARFQVRMPFRQATALITVEREGIAETYVRRLSGKEPMIEIPVKGFHAPNVFVSVLAVRGRVAEVKPTATVDLGRPAHRLGIAEISVGWRAHELKVKVAADRPVYRVRDRASVSITVTTPEGGPPPAGGEVAVAAVDEGLLELRNNETWNLLEAMMAQRPYSVVTSTAHGRVIGKRHFGLKALPQGGGGGKQPTRELFDTLLLWRGRVPLDRNGRSRVEIPLNDSITSFRIVAVATAGLDRFGKGHTSIRSTQDLMILSGLAPVVRQGDQCRSVFTLRNASERAMKVSVKIRIRELGREMEPTSVALASGQSQELAWTVRVPSGIDSMHYELEAVGTDGVTDRLSVSQRVVPAVPVRTFQATLAQITGEFRMDVERPAPAIPGPGGIQVSLRSRLVEGLTGLSEYMKAYPYSCLEQEVSRAVALRDAARWNRLMAALPSYLDSEGLAKYFPSSSLGSVTMTAYLVSIGDEAGWAIPEDMLRRMLEGLKGFVEGRVMRWSRLPTADLAIRKLAAIEALSRHGQSAPALLSSFTIEPNLWPTSAVLDWFNILSRTPAVRNRDVRMKEADQILRSRLNFQGTTMGFSTERTDFLWWLMVSGDSNAVRMILSMLKSPAWREDMPRLVRGAIGRQRRGHWLTTVSNAWGVLAMEKFSHAFEATPVTGVTTASLAGRDLRLDWAAAPKGGTLSFEWPAVRTPLSLRVEGAGRPWATVQSLAAIPLKEPISSGYRIRKTLVPVEQREKNTWSRGDIVRVRLEMEAQADMTWVVVSDPIPAGAAILGTGLGRDSRLLTKGEKAEGWTWPVFEERSFEAFRAYYEMVPKGKWTVEYTLRLNAQGTFGLPPTRVEALYSPEMFGEIPNATIEVR